MACLDENDVAALLGGTLDPESSSGMRRHIEECSDCRRLVAAVVRGARTQAEFPAGQPAATLPLAPGAVPLPRGTLVERYVILELLGAGGMGVVYSAYDPNLERKVALKLVHAAIGGDRDEMSARLLREGKAIARLSHPHVVAVHDMGIFQDQVFIAMELVEAGTLKQWLRERKRTWREVLDKFLAAGEGLAAAHRAGLVHRDFKPENVLLGRDGRIRVTDFGLARSAGAQTSPVPLKPPSVAGAPPGPLVTRTGALMGTPAYMAPEQLAGERADELSDQFSFSVALWEALYGVRPYAGKAASGWQLQAPPGDAAVPQWLRRALLRGLSPAAAQRHRRMEDLLQALAADPRQAMRRRLLIGAAAAATVGLAAVFSYWIATRGARLCRGADEEVATLWKARGDSIRSAFLSTRRADAPVAWELVRRGLDDYWRSWAAARTDACEATRVRGEQSDEILGLRMACLDRRRAEALALIDLFARADPEVIAQAATAVNALTSLRSCADSEGLLAQVRPPEDPAVRGQVEQLRARILGGKALFDTGKYAQGLAAADEAVAAGRKLSYRPALAEALLLLGRLQEHLGDLRAAEATLLEAIAQAEAGRHDEIVAPAATHLMLVLGARQARFAEAHAWGQLADAAIVRIGGDPELHARLFQSVGLVAYAEGHLAEAIEHHRQALSLREKLEPDGMAVALTLNDLGAALRAEGKAPEALAAFRRALEIFVRKLGAESDLAATSRNGIGNVLLAEGQFEEALAAYRDALATFEKALGPSHFRTVTTVNNIGVVFAEQSRFADALPYFERVLEARQDTLGPTNPKVADAHSNIGMLLVELGRRDEAGAHFLKAKEILQGYPIDHFSRAEYLLGFGRIHLAAGAAAKARVPLKQALDLCEGKEGFRFDYTRARAQFALAQAIWESKPDRQRALSLATQARDELVRFGRARFGRDLQQIESWLADRGS